MTLNTQWWELGILFLIKGSINLIMQKLLSEFNKILGFKLLKKLLKNSKILMMLFNMLPDRFGQLDFISFNLITNIPKSNHKQNKYIYNLTV